MGSVFHTQCICGLNQEKQHVSLLDQPVQDQGKWQSVEEQLSQPGQRQTAIASMAGLSGPGLPTGVSILPKPNQSLEQGPAHELHQTEQARVAAQLFPHSHQIA